MKNIQLHDDEDNLNAREGDEFEKIGSDVGVPNPNHDFTKNNVGEGEEGGMWLEREHEDLLDVDDASIFYKEFPPLPDFPCMSSSSSSSPTSSAPPPVNPNGCTSSSSSSGSTASWAFMKADAEEVVKKEKNNHIGEGIPSLFSMNSMEISLADTDEGIEADCMDVMQELGDMDLLDTEDIWDLSSIFPCEDLEENQQQQQLQHGEEEEGKEDEQPSEDLAMLFFEWLKSNKELISADDLRSIKLKRSTIECAARRLGGGKEGMKQLLKLILEWVQNHHLQKKALKEEIQTFPYQHQQQNPQQSFPNTNPNPNPNFNSNFLSSESNPYFPPASMPWISHPAFIPDPITAVMPISYMGDPVFSNGTAAAAVSPFNQHTYSPSSTPDYHMIDSASATWPPQPPHYSFSPRYNSLPDHHQAFPTFGNQYSCQMFQGQGQGQRIGRMGSSATKEARKKRMARQRRVFSHHRSQSHQQLQHQPQHQHHLPSREQQQQQARLATDVNCTTAAAVQGNPWIFWSSTAAAATSTTQMLPQEVPPALDRPPMHGQHYQRQITSERRQGWKTEKNLRFLLQKVLKQSDVGNLGRIVLPKKEAETHLPELEARDGISIAMEDIGTSRIWNLRYRFWPNNKSRMYLLENTGDFVRSNGLQEGDFIVIYLDIKCGKYMIRGVKVRQQTPKSEGKRAGKMQRNPHANATITTSLVGDHLSSSFIKENVT